MEFSKEYRLMQQTFRLKMLYTHVCNLLIPHLEDGVEPAVARTLSRITDSTLTFKKNGNKSVRNYHSYTDNMNYNAWAASTS